MAASGRGLPFLGLKRAPPGKAAMSSDMPARPPPLRPPRKKPDVRLGPGFRRVRAMCSGFPLFMHQKMDLERK